MRHPWSIIKSKAMKNPSHAENIKRNSGQTSWVLIQRSRVRFPALPDFSEQQWVWNRVHSALVRVNEDLLERKVATPV
jgi:hypothetical protein